MRPAALFQTDLRFVSLGLALLLYGVLGSPTPDAPGWTEALIGGLLILSVSLPTVASPRMLFAPLLLIGLSISLAVGLFAGHASDDILRDVIPFLFLCLPFFINPLGHEDMFLRLCLIVGVMFAVRVLGQGMNIFPPQSELLYLANSPLVLMAAIIGLGSAFIDLYHRRITLESFIFFCGGVVCLLAMLIDVQRATIMAVVLSLCGIGAIGLVRAPKRVAWPVFIALAIAISAWEIIASAWHSIATKTALVGVNMRWQEAMAVHERLQGNGLHILFGIGWGGRFESPAVEGISVTFTHSLLTYMFLKTGLAGVVATLIALGACLYNIARHPSLLSLALFWAVLIPVFLYGSYKSLDFGLVLVLAVLLPRAIASRISS